MAYYKQLRVIYTRLLAKLAPAKIILLISSLIYYNGFGTTGCRSARARPVITLLLQHRSDRLSDHLAIIKYKIPY